MHWKTMDYWLLICKINSEIFAFLLFIVLMLFISELSCFVVYKQNFCSLITYKLRKLWMQNWQGLYVYYIIYLLLHDLKIYIHVLLIWSHRKPIDTKLISMMLASVFHTSSTIGQVVIKQFLCDLEVLIIIGTKFPECRVALNVKLSICGNGHLFKVSQIKWGMEVFVKIFSHLMYEHWLILVFAIVKQCYFCYITVIALYVTITFEIFKKEVILTAVIRLENCLLVA